MMLSHWLCVVKTLCDVKSSVKALSCVLLRHYVMLSHRLRHSVMLIHWLCLALLDVKSPTKALCDVKSPIVSGTP
jgi:hypothetical protein